MRRKEKKGQRDGSASIMRVMRVTNATTEGDKVANQKQVKQRCDMETRWIDGLGSQAPAHQEVVKKGVVRSS